MNTKFNQELVRQQMKELEKKGITKAKDMPKKTKEEWKREMMKK
jgi:hypothetical protein